jgi:hypothetical protein
MVPLFSRQPPAANAGHTSVSEICRTISVYQIAQVGRREGLQSPAWRCDGSVEGLLRIICPLLRYAISLMRRQKKKKKLPKGRQLADAGSINYSMVDAKAFTCNVDKVARPYEQPSTS